MADGNILSVEPSRGSTVGFGSPVLARMERMAEVTSKVRKAFQATDRDIDLKNAARIAAALVEYGGPELDPERTLRGLAVDFDHATSGLVSEYREALAEAANPSLVIDRLRRKAVWRAEASARAAHEAKVERERGERMREADPETAEFVIRMAGHSAREAERLMSEAKALKAKADALEAA